MLSERVIQTVAETEPNTAAPCVFRICMSTYYVHDGRVTYAVLYIIFSLIRNFYSF